LGSREAIQLVYASKTALPLKTSKVFDRYNADRSRKMGLGNVLASCDYQCARLSSTPGAAYFGVSDLSWRDGRVLFFSLKYNVKGKIV